MSRRTAGGLGRVVLALTGALTVLAGCSEPETPSSAPEYYNLLLVTLDTLRADHLGCYGYEAPTSPVLDTLAARSVLFENASAQSAVTPVSHASILTGLDPFNHNLRSMHGGRDYALPDDRLTLAEIMRAGGYATAGFVSAFPVTRHYGLNQGFDTWDEAFAGSTGEGVINENGIVNTGGAQRRGDETTTRALRWIQANAEGPFFAWVHLFDVHDGVIKPPAQYLSRFSPESAPGVDRRIATYDAEILFVDEQVGRLLRLLTGLGLRDRTIVVVLSDHGEGLGEHGWWGHSILYQEQLRVPFLISIPWHDRPGRVSDLVRTIDLVPTLVDLLGLDCPGNGCSFDGTSLLPLLAGEDDRPRIAYSESLNDLVAYYRSPWRKDSLYALNDGRWKLIIRREGSQDRPSMLFDLGADPGELSNVIHEQPAVERRLRTHLDRLDAMVDEVMFPPLDPETSDRLRSLGYVD